MYTCNLFVFFGSMKDIPLVNSHKPLYRCIECIDEVVVSRTKVRLTADIYWCALAICLYLMVQDTSILVMRRALIRTVVKCTVGVFHDVQLEYEIELSFQRILFTLSIFFSFWNWRSKERLLFMKRFWNYRGLTECYIHICSFYSSREQGLMLS